MKSKAVKSAITPKKILRVPGHASPLCMALTPFLSRMIFRFPKKVELKASGIENIPNSPCILASNHTHNFDFLPLRHVLYHQKNALASTWIKARAWSKPISNYFLSKTGNVPLASKGYIISIDFIETIGRRPTQTEYRHLRDHLDYNSTLPESEVFETLQNVSRLICGIKYEPSVTNYREALFMCYSKLLDATLAVAADSVENGHHQHINPQGTRSSRLTPGKSGVIHAAMALNIPILPTTIQGVLQSFPKQGMRNAGGTVKIHFGKPYEVRPRLKSNLSPTYKPFRSDPENELIFKDETQQLMSQLHELCDKEHGFLDGYRTNGKVGVDRFI